MENNKVPQATKKVENKKKPVGLFVTAGILGTALIAIIVLFLMQRNNMFEMQQLMTEEKDSLTNELVLLMHGYDTLMSNNDTLNAKLVEELSNCDV